MAWRPLAVLLVLTGTAWSAPIVIKCYDGSSSAIVRWPNRAGTRLGVWDIDHDLDWAVSVPREPRRGRPDRPWCVPRDAPPRSSRARPVRRHDRRAQVSGRPGAGAASGQTTIRCRDLHLS